MNACAKCGATKRKHGTNPYCPSCQTAYKKDYYTQKKQAALEDEARTREWYNYRHDRWLNTHYPNFNRSAYLALLQAQGNACAICQQAETHVDPRTGFARHYTVDYDPETQQVRTLVCHACAKVLAFVHADKARARRLADYIQRWKEDTPDEYDLDICV